MDFDKFADGWLGARVEFSLLGKRVVGEIVEVLDTICASHFVIAEFYDGTKTVKVGASYQAFRRLTPLALDAAGSGNDGEQERDAAQVKLVR